MKYDTGKIYKIVSNVTGEQYIGSTTQELDNRLNFHKNDYCRWKDGKGGFMSSFNIINTEDYNIVLIENYPCKDKKELHTRERYWIENTKCVNMCIPTQTPKEYYEKYKEILKEESKQRYYKNHEKRLATKKIYRDTHREEIRKKDLEKKKEIVVCECGASLTRAHLLGHKKTNKHKENLSKLSTTL